MAIEPLVAIKLTFLLGWANIIGLFLVLLSCRCIPTILPLKIRESKFYQKLFDYHCYYWWLFIISVLLHALLAITAFGNPFV